jgi:predicted metal-dependent phosphoesterase TrpH
MNDHTEFMKIDLHCHSEASFDCITPLEDILDRCRERGIRVQAITDHNEVWAAQKLKAQTASDPSCQVTVLVGEEISTSEGEIIGLFLQEKIDPGLPPEETIRQIREQNGLVLLPHGFDPLKRYRLRPDARERLADEFDIIETFNARISRPTWNNMAVAWAEEKNMLMSGGSDAHRLKDIGEAWTEAPLRPIHTAADLTAALKAAKQPEGYWTHPVWAFTKKSWERLGTRIRPRFSS